MSLLLGILMGVAHSAGELNLGSYSITDNQTAPATATAGASFLNNGSWVEIPFTPHVTEWWTEQPSPNIGDLYEVAFTTLVSGSDGPEVGLGIGVFGGLDTTRTWSFSTSGGVKSGVWRFVIRLKTDPGISITGDMSMSVISL